MASREQMIPETEIELKGIRSESEYGYSKKSNTQSPSHTLSMSHPEVGLITAIIILYM